MRALETPNRTLLGILFMCVSAALFPVMLGMVHLLGPRYGPEQLVWARQLAQLVFLLAFFTPTLGVSVLRTTRLPWQVLRSTALLGSTLLLYFGAKFLPVVKSTSISLLGPSSWPCWRGRCSASA